jgi:hypothetical protein
MLFIGVPPGYPYPPTMSVRLVRSAVFVGAVFLATPTASASAYEFPAHFTVTIWIAELVGFSSADAYEIAKFDQATDDDPATDPLGLLDRASVRRRRLYHFPDADRMKILRRGAERCGRRPGPREFKAIGWYLHALEDVHSHKSHGPRLGHLITWHTQDQPWTKPGDFLAMVDAKFRALVALRERCGEQPKVRPTAESDYKRARTLIELWVQAEYDGGVDDPESPGRFEVLARDLYGSKYESAIQEYRAWVNRQKQEGWKSR